MQPEVLFGADPFICWNTKIQYNKLDNNKCKGQALDATLGDIVPEERLLWTF